MQLNREQLESGSIPCCQEPDCLGANPRSAVLAMRAGAIHAWVSSSGKCYYFTMLKVVPSRAVVVRIEFKALAWLTVNTLCPLWLLALFAMSAQVKWGVLKGIKWSPAPLWDRKWLKQKSLVQHHSHWLLRTWGRGEEGAPCRLRRQCLRRGPSMERQPLKGLHQGWPVRERESFSSYLSVVFFHDWYFKFFQEESYAHKRAKQI